MAVVVNIALELAVPVIHVRIIYPVKIGVVVSNGEKHAHVIRRMFPQGIVHHFAVVKIFVDVSRAAVGVIISVDPPQRYPEKYLDAKQRSHCGPGESFDTEKFKAVYERDEKSGIKNGEKNAHALKDSYSLKVMRHSGWALRINLTLIFFISPYIGVPKFKKHETEHFHLLRFSSGIPARLCLQFVHHRKCRR